MEDERYEDLEGEQEAEKNVRDRRISIGPSYGEPPPKRRQDDIIEVVESERNYLKRDQEKYVFVEEVKAFSRSVSSFREAVQDFAKSVKFFQQLNNSLRYNVREKRFVDQDKASSGRELTKAISPALKNVISVIREPLRELFFSLERFGRDLSTELLEFVGTGFFGPLFDIVSDVGKVSFNFLFGELSSLRKKLMIERFGERVYRKERSLPPPFKFVEDSVLSGYQDHDLTQLYTEKIVLQSPVTLFQERQSQIVAQKLNIKVDKKAVVEGLDVGIPDKEFAPLRGLLASFRFGRLGKLSRLGASAALATLLLSGGAFATEEIRKADLFANLRTVFRGFTLGALTGFFAGGPKGALIGAVLGGVISSRPWQLFLEQQRRERLFFKKSFEVVISRFGKLYTDFGEFISELRKIFFAFLSAFKDLKEEFQSLSEVFRDIVSTISRFLKEAFVKTATSAKEFTQKLKEPVRDVGKSVTEFLYKGFGDITAFFESGKKLWSDVEKGLSLFTVGMGKYFGPWQMTEKTFQKFAIEYGYWERLKGKKWLSESFKKEWEKIVREVGEDIIVEQQREFLTKTHYLPLLSTLGERGKILSSRGKALQEQLFAISVQYGPRYGAELVSMALKKYTDEQLKYLDPEIIISEIQQYRKETLSKYFPRFGAEVKRSISLRLEKEMEYYRKLLESEREVAQAKQVRTKSTFFESNFLPGTDVKPLLLRSVPLKPVYPAEGDVSLERLKKSLEQKSVTIPKYVVDYEATFRTPEVTQKEEKPKEKTVVPFPYVFDMEKVPNYVDDIATILLQLGLI